jgi:DNA-binding IclR family transcriptional regulator
MYTGAVKFGGRAMNAQRRKAASVHAAGGAASRSPSAEGRISQKLQASAMGQTRLERPMLLRALKLLETVAAAGRDLSLSELSVTLDLPKPTVFRLAQRLEQGGYVAREPGRSGFTIGPRLLRLGLDVVRTSGPNAERRAILKALVARLGESCNFTMLSGSEVLNLDRVDTRWPLRAHLEPGSRMPLHCTASGKLLLAFQPADRRKRLLEALPLTRETPSTLTSADELEQECARIVRDGYSTENEEYQIGVIAVAVPVQNTSGAVVGGLACHAPIARLSLSRAINDLPELREAAKRLGGTLTD